MLSFWAIVLSTEALPQSESESALGHNGPCFLDSCDLSGYIHQQESLGYTLKPWTLDSILQMICAALRTWRASRAAMAIAVVEKSAKPMGWSHLKFICEAS